MPRLIFFAGLVAGLALVPAAGGANELIRPGQGIGRVELGMTEPQVRRALGTPQAVIRRRVGFGRLSVEWQFDGGAWRVKLVGRRGSLRVTSVATMVRRERTREGYGVGTLERTLRRRYGTALRCERLRSEGGIVWGRGNVRSCSLRGPGGTRLVWTSASPRETGDITRVAEWLREARVIEVAVVASGAKQRRTPFVGDATRRLRPRRSGHGKNALWINRHTFVA